MRSSERVDCVVRKLTEGVLVGLIVLVGTAIFPVESVAQEAAAADGTGLISDAPVFPAVTPPSRYQDAIDKGTRTVNGRPGGDYCCLLYTSPSPRDRS